MQGGVYRSGKLGPFATMDSEVKIVTDSKGNTWYEFDIPERFKSGKGEIKAFKDGGWLNKYK